MIELHYFDRSHIPQLMSWIDTPEFLLQWAGPTFHYPLTEQQIEKYMESANMDGSNSFIYSVLLKETGEVIGHIALTNMDRVHKSARVGKVLIGDPRVRGKGIGSLMMKEVLKIAFEQFHLHRVSLGVFDFNQSAIACYEKAGFTKEGLLRECRKIGNQYWSLWEMSILAHEWKKTFLENSVLNESIRKG